MSKDEALEIANCDLKQPAQEPVWQGLTEKEILIICAKIENIEPQYITKKEIQFARAIEQALKEKNT